MSKDSGIEGELEVAKKGGYMNDDDIDFIRQLEQLEQDEDNRKLTSLVSQFVRNQPEPENNVQVQHSERVASGESPIDDKKTIAPFKFLELVLQYAKQTYGKTKEEWSNIMISVNGDKFRQK